MHEARVLVLSDYGGGETAATGGAGHAVVESYRALREAGIDTEMIVGFGQPDLSEPGRVRSLEGRDLRAGGRTDTLRVIYHAAARSALERMLATTDPARTLVILHQWTRFLSPSVAFTLRRFNTMIYMHDYFWACPNGAYFDFTRETPCTERPAGPGCIARACDRDGRVSKLGRLARHAVLSQAATGHESKRLFLSLSPDAAATAARLLPHERHATILNPLRMDAVYPQPAPAPEFDIGYFGRLEPEKGVGRLCDAAASLGATSLFVGQGALEPHVRDTPGATHLSWQPREMIARAMRRCRVIVLPSLWPETWGLIVPEAMSAGVAVLVSRRAGSAALVSRYGGGATFDPAIPGDLTQALSRMLAQAAPSRISARDWPHFRQALSPAAHAARIAELAGSRWNLELAMAPSPDDAPAASPPAAEAGRSAVLPQLAT